MGLDDTRCHFSSSIGTLWEDWVALNCLKSWMRQVTWFFLFIVVDCLKLRHLVQRRQSSTSLHTLRNSAITSRTPQTILTLINKIGNRLLAIIILWQDKPWISIITPLLLAPSALPIHISTAECAQRILRIDLSVEVVALLLWGPLVPIRS